MARISSYGSRPYGEPLDPPDVPDAPFDPNAPTQPVVPPTSGPPRPPGPGNTGGPVVPVPVDTGNTGIPRPTPLPEAPYVPPLINTQQYQLPGAGGYGDDKQAGGGWGSPYVGTGWNNLSNYLNEGNIGFGQSLKGEPAPMDLSTGRGQSQAGFEDWMWNAGGKTPAPTEPAPTNRGPSDTGGGTRVPGQAAPGTGPRTDTGTGTYEPVGPPPPRRPEGVGRDTAPKEKDPWANFDSYTQRNSRYNTP